MAKVLACTCGDCTHWEIISHPSLEPTSVQWGPLGHPAAQAAALTSVLKCKTCGKEFHAFIRVDRHANLKEVERLA